MNRIPRYVLLDLVKVFLVALTAMTVLIMLGGVAQEAIRQGLGPLPIMRLMPYLLPESLRYAVPATMLFAACSVYGRMSSGNEIVALKSVGISPAVVFWPAVVLAFCLSLASVWLNDLAATWGRRGVHRVVLQSVEEIAYGMLRTQRSYGTNRFSINVKRVEGRKLIRPTLVFQASKNSPQVTLAAAEAELRSNAERNELSILLTNGTIDVGDDVTAVFPDTIERVVPLSDASKKGEFARGAGELPLAEIPGEIARQEKTIHRLEEIMAAEAGYRLLSGDFTGLSENEWAKRREELTHARDAVYRLQVEPWRRWANGFSCLFFVMVGAPLAVLMRKSDLASTFGAAFCPVLLAYYPALVYFTDRAKMGQFPSFMAWTGNVLLALWGLWLMRSVIRDKSAIPDWLLAPLVYALSVRTRRPARVPARVSAPA